MKQDKNRYDLIVVGAGPSGMIASIVASRKGKRVLLLEKLSKVGTKLKATGGGRCNLTNTLHKEDFMEKFGKDGRFLSSVLERFDASDLITFFKEIGVETHAPDGFRIFPKTHQAQSIVQALHHTLIKEGVTILCQQSAQTLLISEHQRIQGIKTQSDTFFADAVIIATGGKGYPQFGTQGDGYQLAKEVGHTISEPYPAMMPLKVEESWVEACRADTLPKVTIKVDLKKYRKLTATGDLIFTKDGIRGPVVLDFSREITPLLEKYERVPILIHFTKGMNEESIRQTFKEKLQKNPHLSTLELLSTLIPSSLARVLCQLANIDPHLHLQKQKGLFRDKLYQLLVWTPLHVIGHDGFKMAMVTRGGISLKEIEPHTMQSRKVHSLYFCGEVVNIDGPCGGYNLQWAFSSGYVAGSLSS